MMIMMMMDLPGIWPNLPPSWRRENYDVNFRNGLNMSKLIAKNLTMTKQKKHVQCFEALYRQCLHVWISHFSFLPNSFLPHQLSRACSAGQGLRKTVAETVSVIHRHIL